MASESEINFANTRNKLRLLLAECINTSTECFGVNWTSMNSNLVSLTSDHPLPHTIANQQLIEERVYAGGKIGFIIGADHDWNPIVTITSSSADPLTFTLHPDLKEYHQVREAIVNAFRALST